MAEIKVLDEMRTEFRSFSLIGELGLCSLQFSLLEYDSVPESPHQMAQVLIVGCRGWAYGWRSFFAAVVVALSTVIH